MSYYTWTPCLRQGLFDFIWGGSSFIFLLASWRNCQFLDTLCLPHRLRSTRVTNGQYHTRLWVALEILISSISPLTVSAYLLFFKDQGSLARLPRLVNTLNSSNSFALASWGAGLWCVCTKRCHFLPDPLLSGDVLPLWCLASIPSFLAISPRLTAKP